MIDAINIAGAALRANQTWLDSISANVSNINTPGYKARDVSFDNAVQSAAGGTGLIQASAGAPDMATGDIRQTGRELDVAINGKGFFRVRDQQGAEAYTRLGRLVVAEDGRLMLPNGWLLADDIAIPPDALRVEITTFGEVRVKLPDQANMIAVGNIRTVQIGDLASLQEISPGIYASEQAAASADTGAPGVDARGHLQQGHLEYSNVDLVNEMSQLVIAQRAYQLNARVLQIGDQVLETINNLRR